MNARIAKRRLANQFLTRTGPRRPADVVSWFGAVQVQEFEAAKWALGLRMRDGIGDADVERAFGEGRILRTHVMRPTWHFVAPQDIRWLLGLTAPRVHRAMSVYRRQLELDARTLARGTAVIERALDGRHLTRAEIAERLKRARLDLKGVRLAHVMMYAELEAVVCSGPRRGKAFTYALLDERAPHGQRFSRDEALAELSRRYFTSHGPATIRDFVWWSGLTTIDARRSLEMNKTVSESVDGLMYWTMAREAPHASDDRFAHLLPVYDEYLVAYRDRTAVPHGPSMFSWSSRPATFQHAFVIAGQVAGTWRPTREAESVHVRIALLRRLSRREQRALADSARHYERFLSQPVKLAVISPRAPR